jgi:23S rRNA (uracil1939-C5)-methyltransferase
MKPGDVVSLTVDKPAAGGRMIARLDGRVVLVGGAIPGERVTARIERVSKQIAYAQTTSVDEASPDRRPTVVDPECGGALYSHVAYERQLVLKRDVIVDAFTRIGRLTLPATFTVAASREDGYRMRARLHVRARRVGFFREATHDLCDVRATRQLLPATCDTLDRVSAILRSLGVDAVREIELSENVDASARALALDADAPIDTRIVERIADVGGITGVVARAGTRGCAHVIDRLELGGDTLEWQRHVLAFFQGNRYLLRDLVAHVIAQLSDGPAIDLYAGVGLFAIAAARTRGVAVTAVEGDQYAAADLHANAAHVAGVRAMHTSVEDFVRRDRPQPDTPRPATVIVDPPRTGMSREALDGAVEIAAPRIVYVSCDVATLARDARRIVDAGYAIARADAFDLFPNTPHVETVIVFDR